MAKIHKKNKKFFSSLIDMFSGLYETTNPEIKALKEEILFPEHPGSFSEDKKNLSLDIYNISRDMQKKFFIK